MKVSEKLHKLNILFLCTGNACRSQMAEGWARTLKSDCIKAFSAGIMPATVSARAVKVMAEVGIDVSRQYSKHVNDLEGISFDYVITLCDYANENCPVFYGKGKLIHKPFADPMFAVGSDESIMNAFRKTRDDIKNYILTLPQSLEQEFQKEKNAE